MSRYTELSNKNVKVKIDELGAQLVSLVNMNKAKEYLWTGDESYWGGQSPVLFPIVGSINESTLKFEGQTQTMGNHGFARKMTFSLGEVSQSKVSYSLTYNNETLSQYPYKFELLITYILEDHGVRIEYKVINKDDQTIYFQLGTHPGFNCPLKEDLAFDDYQILFNREENAKRYFCNAGNRIISNKEEDGLVHESMMKLNHESFYEGAHIFRGVESTSFTLKTEKDSAYVKVDSENLPYLGIWQPKDAPFICIEPWHGVGDLDNYTGRFEDKEMMIALEVGAVYDAAITISIG